MGEPRGNRGRELSDLIARPKPKCNRRIRILNGVTRIRERGSLARFQCSHGFTLIGPTTIVCLRDQWSEPPPICVKNGCRLLRTPRNGAIRQSIGGAVVAFFCHGNSRLVGKPMIYCDGVNWNGTEPTCYIEPVDTTTYEPVSEEEHWPASDNPSFLQGSGVSDGDEAWDTNLNSFTTPSVSWTTEHEFTPENNGWNNDSKITNTVLLYTTEDSSPPKETTIPFNDPTLSITESVAVTAYTANQKAQATETPLIYMHNEIDAHFFNTTTMKAITPKKLDDVPSTTMLTEILHTQRDKMTPPLPPPTSTEVAIMNHTIVPPMTTAQVPVTILRKMRTRKPRRPVFTRRPLKGPTRFNIRPGRKQKKTTPPAPQKTTGPTFTSSDVQDDFRSFNMQTSSESVKVENAPISPNAAIPDPGYSNTYKSMPTDLEHVAAIRPIIFPDMLSVEDAPTTPPRWNASMIAGISLFLIGLVTFSTGVFLYCWRKNKGIARARPYDMDGRTLSAHDANDDFMWLDQRDSRL